MCFSEGLDVLDENLERRAVNAVVGWQHQCGLLCPSRNFRSLCGCGLCASQEAKRQHSVDDLWHVALVTNAAALTAGRLRWARFGGKSRHLCPLGGAV
eukprot:scaffold32039_cov197-Isochrysis_galbana.AAC.1